MSASLVAVAYVAAIILFILSLGGLSSPESSRRGNLYGMIGMTIAVLATVLGPQVTKAGYPWIVGAMAVGAVIGLFAARVGKRTRMRALVAPIHSLVGLVAVLGGGGHRVHAEQRSADRHRRAGGILRRDPLLHHVPRDEPQLRQRDRRRLRHRRRRAGGRGCPTGGRSPSDQRARDRGRSTRRA